MSLFRAIVLAVAAGSVCLAPKLVLAGGSCKHGSCFHPKRPPRVGIVESVAIRRVGRDFEREREEREEEEKAERDVQDRLDELEQKYKELDVQLEKLLRMIEMQYEIMKTWEGKRQ